MPRHAFGEISSNCRPKLGLGLLATSCLLLFGCSSGEGELVGFGKYKLGKTTPGDSYVMGRCDPKGSNTFCFMNRSPSIAGHKTQTDLYFRGHGDDAPLIEIQVGVWDCKVGPVSQDLHKKLGEPTEAADKRALWTLKKMSVVALLPMDSNLCMVHFLETSDTKRIDSLFRGTAPELNAPAKSAPKSAPAKDQAEPAPAKDEAAEPAPAKDEAAKPAADAAATAP
tara:strand:+ start:5862 stop:6536 length:675 start_codon:yes stop_codon:yes gene_type:complete